MIVMEIWGKALSNLCGTQAFFLDKGNCKVRTEHPKWQQCPYLPGRYKRRDSATTVHSTKQNHSRHSTFSRAQDIYYPQQPMPLTQWGWKVTSSPSCSLRCLDWHLAHHSQWLVTCCWVNPITDWQIKIDWLIDWLIDWVDFIIPSAHKWSYKTLV